MDLSSANYPKDKHTKNKRAGWKMAEEKGVNKLHSEERKEPYNTLNRTNIVQQQSGKWPQKRKEKKRNTLSQRSPKKVLKKN